MSPPSIGEQEPLECALSFQWVTSEWVSFSDGCSSIFSSLWRSPKLTLGLAALVLAVCVAYAARRLTVSSDQNKLFSPKVKFFHDWLEFDRKFPENQAIYVVIEPVDWKSKPSLEQWIQINERITGRLERMPEQVSSVIPSIPMDNPKAPPILFSNSSDLPEEFYQLKHSRR